MAAADALFLDSRAAGRLTRPMAVLAADPLLKALVDRAVADPLKPDNPADRRLFAVLLDQLIAARSLPLLVRAPTAAQPASGPAVSQATPGLPPSIPAMATTLGASRRTLERAFARDVGLTVGRWRQQVRLTRAVALLADGRRVADVAREVGYRTPSAFVAAFKKAMGTTPKRFVARRA